MALRAQESVAAVAVHRGAEEEAQHTAHLLVELAGGVLAGFDGLLVGGRQVVVVVGVGGAHGQTVGPGAELHVQSVAHGLVGVVATAPVAHHHTVEAPVAFQYLVQHYGIVAVVLVFIEIVGAHDAPCLTLGHGCLEGGQVYLVKGAVAHYHVQLVAVLFVVVQGVVFHAGGHTVLLQTLHIGHHHTRGQIGVLAHIFEVAAVERGAEDVHAGSQYHVLAAVEGFLAQRLPIEQSHLWIPGGGQTGECREGHTRVVGLSCLFPLVPKHIGAHAVRAVVGPEVGQAQSFHTGAGEFALGMNHGYLLVEGHAPQGIVHSLLYRQGLVEVGGLLCAAGPGSYQHEDCQKGSFHHISIY